MSQAFEPKFTSLLIANRGEIAIRIARAAGELGLRTVAVYAEDDAESLHRTAADDAVPLNGAGVAAYLDGDAIIRQALQAGCQAIHPGYGFLSENGAFARACAAAGLTFIGPTPEVMDLFGDKAKARAFAARCQVPMTAGTQGPTTLEQARQFMTEQGRGAVVMVKAVAGGGGRGMRVVRAVDQLADAYARCQSEAQKAFGNPALYVERFIESAHHIEVQIIGDGRQVIPLGERDCSVQRRNQKVVEIAPSPWLPDALRERIIDASVQMAQGVGYSSLGTFEFLVERPQGSAPGNFFFIEANPRLQVEHTVTEEVTGVDLVKTQLALAQGQTLKSLNLSERAPRPEDGFAIQFRINMDELPGRPQTDDGVLHRYDVPSGPGIRVDGFGYAGFAPSRRFDSLLAKLIVSNRSPLFSDAVARAYRALCEFQVDGVPSNLPMLRNLARDPAFIGATIDTPWLDANMDRLSVDGDASHRTPAYAAPAAGAAFQGAAARVAPVPVVDDPGAVGSPMRGALLELSVAPGDAVAAGQQVAVLEAMKMEHVITAPVGGRVRELLADVGAQLAQGQTLLVIDVADGDAAQAIEADDAQRDDSKPNAALQEVIRLHELTLDAMRPKAVARRHKSGMRTARENLDDLCDAGSFFEYGQLALAARRKLHSVEELQEISPADGFIGGFATVNAALFGADAAKCCVASYDYSVFAGTQGLMGHRKNDRLFELAEQARAPVVIFCEGGGGRPTDSDNIGGVNLANPTFVKFARLSGLVPLVGIVAGRCFAGNAAQLGSCDVIIATENASIGMGGPVMIEGAGLGVVKPDDVGPAPMHARRGVVDVLVKDEAEAVAVAKRYLAYFQGPVSEWQAHDQLSLRSVIPERRTRAYDVRTVIETIADIDSVLELRPLFGPALITALIRIEGKTVAVMANDPSQNAGAISSDEADKIARFLQLCDAFDLPVLSLCDTPGIMVGTEAEQTAIVRHSSRILLVGANVDIPYFTIVLRKGYGLGAMAMARGSFHQGSFFTVAWPTAEFGGMGLEGQVRLGNRNELAAIEDPVARQARFQELVDRLYQIGKATNIAPFLSIDDVIDPAASRAWVLAGLRTVHSEKRRGKKRANVDAW